MDRSEGESERPQVAPTSPRRREAVRREQAERDSPEAKPFASVRFPPGGVIIAMFRFIGSYLFFFPAARRGGQNRFFLLKKKISGSGLRKKKTTLNLWKYPLFPAASSERPAFPFAPLPLTSY